MKSKHKYFNFSYVMMIDQEKPFNVKSELFTEYSEKNRYLLDLIKQERKKMVMDKTKKMSTSTIGLYDPNISRKNKFNSTNLKKSWNGSPHSSGQNEKGEDKEKFEKNYSTLNSKFNIKSGVIYFFNIRFIKKYFTNCRR